MMNTKGFCWLLLLFFGTFISAISKPVTVKCQWIYKGTQTHVYLYKYLGNVLTPFDSAVQKNGVFEYKFAEPIARGFYKIGFTKEDGITLILGNESMTITGDPAIAKSIVITGSKENDVYAAYKKLTQNQNDQNGALNKKAKEISQQPGMTEELYNIQIAVLQKSQDSITNIYNANVKNLITANPSLFITKVMAMFMMDETTTAETYFSSAEFTDKEYAAGDMLPSKIQFYFQYLVNADIYSWKAATEKLISSCPPSSDNRQVIYLTLLPMYMQNDPDYARALAKQYITDYPNSPEAKQLVAQLPKGPPSVGDMAQDITLADYNGVLHSLSALRGKVVLIDFWASWCGPCRGENPNVVNAYNKYKDMGFTVFSVSLDTNKEQWLAAIQKDGLIWPDHVSDLKGWKSDPANLYAVRGIPATFLLDKDGKIVATNLRGDALHAKLEELLNKP